MKLNFILALFALATAQIHETKDANGNIIIVQNGVTQTVQAAASTSVPSNSASSTNSATDSTTSGTASSSGGTASSTGGTDTSSGTNTTSSPSIVPVTPLGTNTTVGNTSVLAPPSPRVTPAASSGFIPQLAASVLLVAIMGF